VPPAARGTAGQLRARGCAHARCTRRAR
jgi:hypothetical protein